MNTFGAPEEEWLEARKIHAIIKDFKLLDPARAPKNPHTPPVPATADNPSGTSAPNTAGSTKPRP